MIKGDGTDRLTSYNRSGCRGIAARPGTLGWNAEPEYPRPTDRKESANTWLSVYAFGVRRVDQLGRQFFGSRNARRGGIIFIAMAASSTSSSIGIRMNGRSNDGGSLCISILQW